MGRENDATNEHGCELCKQLKSTLTEKKEELAHYRRVAQDTGRARLQRDMELSALVEARNEALEELLLSREALLSSEAKLAIAMNFARVGYWELSKDGQSALWSRHVYELYGLPESFPAGTQTLSQVTHPEDFPALRQSLENAITSANEHQVTFRIRRVDDGSERWIHCRGKPVIGADGVPEKVVGFVQDITEQKVAEEKIHQLAFYDQLTALPNRTHLRQRIKQAIETSEQNGRHGALLLIDLDNFKALNDTHGHDAGDVLLQLMAQRLKDCVREEDVVARLGGDEFVVMLVDLSEKRSEAVDQVEHVGKRIHLAFSQSFQFKGTSSHITLSIGASIFRGNDIDVDALIKQSDLAMYSVKDSGRNNIRFFETDMELAISQRLKLERDLYEAVEKNHFALYYQPQIHEGHIVGAEVLVRWLHPTRGLVLPAEFITLTEEKGLIEPFGHWVLDTACKQLAVWAKRPEMAHLTISVNVSVSQFRQHNFVNQVLTILESTRANPKHLKLELTENLLVTDMEEIAEKMFALKKKGVAFSLDDFGTGYSSLLYLKRLPLDQLKIDRSFVRDLLVDANDAAIVKTIITLAKSLGLGVIAEGVETAHQRDFLAEMGCDTYQGYYFSQPLPIHDFEAFLLKN